MLGDTHTQPIRFSIALSAMATAFLLLPASANAFLLAQATTVGLETTAPEVGVRQSQIGNLSSLNADFLAAESMGFESMARDGKGSPGIVDQKFNMLGLRNNKNTFYFPVYKQESMFKRQSYTQLDAWGVKWQHDLNKDSSFSLAASHSDNVYAEETLQNTTSNMATLSWTSRFAGSKKPSLTGSVFLGDEAAAEESDELHARRYYGFSLGGQMTIFRSHTPYLQVKLQKSRYQLDEELNTLEQVDGNIPDPDYYSRLSAGWRWKVRGNWSVNAEANYSSSEKELNWRFNESKIFFGTRYDFR
jgi:hypothetical protein